MNRKKLLSRSLVHGRLSGMTLSSLSNFLFMLSRKWVGEEVIQTVAYDVPIPGYKTKNTNSLLRLWEAKANAENFDLFQYNDGQYESAAQLHSRAQQIYAVLYPGDATESGKLLRLEQQFFICSASLQIYSIMTDSMNLLHNFTLGPNRSMPLYIPGMLLKVENS